MKRAQEIVLPPERGTGIRKARPDSEPPRGGIAQPRELQAPPAQPPGPVEPEAAGEGVRRGPLPALESDPYLGRIEVGQVELAKPAAGEDSTPARVPCPPRRRAAAGRRFAVAYGGRIVGHYSAGRITNRKAFQSVAAALHGRVPGFDPAELELFQLVPVEITGRELPSDPHPAGCLVLEAAAATALGGLDKVPWSPAAGAAAEE